MRGKKESAENIFHLTSSLWPHNSPKTHTSNSIWRWGMSSQNKLFSLLASGWISYSEYLAWPPCLKRRGGMAMLAFSLSRWSFRWENKWLVRQCCRPEALCSTVFSAHLQSLTSATMQISLHSTGYREGYIAQFSLSSSFTFDPSWARLSSCFGVNLGRKNLFSPRIWNTVNCKLNWLQLSALLYRRCKIAEGGLEYVLILRASRNSILKIFVRDRENKIVFKLNWKAIWGFFFSPSQVSRKPSSSLCL